MEKYSPEFWNQQASSDCLTRDLIQLITGMTFSTKWNADKTVDYFWYKDVANRAPGFAAAGLLLDPGVAPKDVTPFIGAADYPNWVCFRSANGFIAPGATSAWGPTVQGPIPPAPSTPAGVGPSTVPPPSQTPPVRNSPTAAVCDPTWPCAPPPSGNLLNATTPAQPNATATRTPPNVWLWLALAGATIFAFAYLRGRA